MTNFWHEVTEEDRAAIEKLITEVRDHQQADTLFALEKGAEITKWKFKITHGNLLDTLAEKAGLQPRKAQRWMKAAKAFHGQFDLASKLPRQALYHLSAKGTKTAKIRAEVLDELRAGSNLTAAEIQERCGIPKAGGKPKKESEPKAKDSVLSPDAANEAWTLFALLASEKDQAIKILNGPNWDLVCKELLRLLQTVDR